MAQAVSKKEKKTPPASETKPSLPPRRKYFYACGKRKSSIARVRLFPKGHGDFVINEKSLEEYITVKSLAPVMLAPLKLTNHQEDVDISVKVKGGGIQSQAEAIRHGISKTLLEMDGMLRATLRKAGFLTRDSRIKERKKPGLKRARRAPQWQKR